MGANGTCRGCGSDLARCDCDANRLDELTAMKQCDCFENDFFVLSAVQYAMGRMTYIVSDTTEWVKAVWPRISDSTRANITRDIDDALERDDSDRDADNSNFWLGHDCDRASWHDLRVFIYKFDND